MTRQHRFSGVARCLHWIMAALIVAALFIGVGMVTTTTYYHDLVSIHRPLGIAILVLAAIRLIYRLFHSPPPLPAAMPSYIRIGASISHIALYALMFAVPIVGWSMLSAEGFPIELYGSLRLPPILPVDPDLYAILRPTHTILALLLFLVFLFHLAAALLHALVFRDGVFESMASLPGTDETTGRP